MVQRALEKHNVAQPWARDYQLFQVLPGDRGEQGQLGAWAKGRLAGEDGRLSRVVLEQSRGEMQQGGVKRQKNINASLRWDHEVVLVQCEGRGHQKCLPRIYGEMSLSGNLWGREYRRSSGL